MKGAKWTDITVLRAVQADHYSITFYNAARIIHIAAGNNFVLKLDVQDVWQLTPDFTASNQKQASLLPRGHFRKTVHCCI